jgi:hypothetical protein
MPSINNPTFKEMQLVEEACAAFQVATHWFKAKPSLPKVTSSRIATSMVADTTVQFEISGHKFAMPVYVKAHVGNSGGLLAQHHMHARHADGSRPLMLITQHVGPDLAAVLVERNVPFMDTAGNAYLAEPEGTVMITGRPRPSNRIMTPGTRSTTRTGLQVMFALATQPGLANMPYRTIADMAGVSLNSVKQAMDDLLARGLVGKSRSGFRVLPDWSRFVAEWVSLYPSRLRPKLGGRRFTSTSPDWWLKFDFTAFNTLLGGEAAAEVMTNHLKATGAIIYTHAVIPTDFMLRARLRPDERGDVEILEAFWPASPVETRKEYGLPLVHPLLIYADLVATGDDRNRSIAEKIYDAKLATLHAQSQ